MKTSIRIIAVSAVASLFSIAAYAQGEGEGASGMTQRVQSTATVKAMKPAAHMTMRWSDGSTGEIGVLNSGLSRDAVKAEAMAAARTRSTSGGEIGSM